MPKYRFRALDIENRKIKGTFIAENDEDLKTIIKNQNYYLISYHKIPESSQIFTFLEKIRVEEFTLFCRQFSIMVSAGLNIDRTVEILKNSVRNPKLKSILEVVYNDLLKGIMLSESLGKYPKTFPVFFRNMVELGELSGKLDVVFLKLAEYYEKDAITKRKMKSAMSYPLFLFGMLGMAFVAILGFVMPAFESIFVDMGATVPQITQVMMDMSHFLKEYWRELIIGILVVFAILWLLGRTSLFKKIFDRAKLNVPLIKDIQIAMLTSRFSTCLNVLLSSSMGVLDAVNAISRLMGNVIVAQEIKVVGKEISTGRSVGSALQTINRFPKMLVEMIEIGESVGRLEEILEHTTTYYTDEVDVSIKRMTSSLGPIMIMIVAVVIVMAILAVFMPMLDLMTALNDMETQYV